MKNFKRIFALLSAFLLLCLYLCTFIFAFMDSTATMNFFWASVICTVLLPVTFYGYSLFYKVINRNNNSDDSEDDTKE